MCLLWKYRFIASRMLTKHYHPKVFDDSIFPPETFLIQKLEVFFLINILHMVIRFWSRDCSSSWMDCQIIVYYTKFNVSVKDSITKRYCWFLRNGFRLSKFKSYYFRRFCEVAYMQKCYSLNRHTTLKWHLVPAG
jgi:hypothetical protein